MTAPVTTPRADDIAGDLLRDARAFLAAQGAELHSREVEALARAVARHLAALEEERGLAQEAGPVKFTIVPVSESVSFSTPLRDAALGLQEPPVPPPQPRMLIVQRWDREAPESVSEGEVRWGLDLHGHLEGKAGRERAWFSWGLCEVNPRGSKVPYARQSPNSPWGIRVEILGGR